QDATAAGPLGTWAAGTPTAQVADGRLHHAAEPGAEGEVGVVLEAGHGLDQADEDHADDLLDVAGRQARLLRPGPDPGGIQLPERLPGLGVLDVAEPAHEITGGAGAVGGGAGSLDGLGQPFEIVAVAQVAGADG